MNIHLFHCFCFSFVKEFYCVAYVGIVFYFFFFFGKRIFSTIVFNEENWKQLKRKAIVCVCVHYINVWKEVWEDILHKIHLWGGE